MSKMLMLMTGAAAVAVLVSGEAKATIFTMTGTGTVGCGTFPVSELTLPDCGTDGLGLFGTPGGGLSGDSFTIAMTFDTDDEWSTPFSNEIELNLYAYGTTSITINNRTFTFTNSGPSTLMLNDSLSVDGPGGDECNINLPTPGDESVVASPDCDLLDGLTANSNSQAELLVWSFSDNFFIEPTLVDHTIQPDDGVEFYFDTCNDTNTVCTSFGDPLNSITLNATTVPEPASLSLFGAALAWFGVKRRRRRR